MRNTASVTIALVLLLVTPMGAAPSSSEGQSLDGFLAGPYLLDVTTDSATVAFHLASPLPAVVKIFDNERIMEFASKVPAKSHFVKVSGLQSGSTYNYQVICGDDQIQSPIEDDSFQVRTACREGESFSFAVYGDPRPGDTMTTQHHREIIEQITLHEPSFSIVLGDMVDDGRDIQLWQQFFEVESPVLRSSAIYAVLGDNDYAGGDGLFAQFFPKLQKGYYKFHWGGVYFFGLNAWDATGKQDRNQITAQSPQIRWLESELSREAVRKASFRVVFMHDPVYISRGQSADILKRIWAPIFEKYNVDLVFSSWHLYERSRNRGVTYVSSGGAGAELFWSRPDPAYPSQAEARRHHFCRVDVTEGAMTIRAIADDGTVLDNMTLTGQSGDVFTAGQIERLAGALQKQIFINSQNNLPEIVLHLFSYDCAYCRRLLKHDLPKLARENNLSIRVYYYDFSLKGTYDLFLNAGVEFGRQGADIPAIFIGRKVLGGQSEIDSRLKAELEDFLSNPKRYREQTIIPFKQTHDTDSIRESSFEALTSGIVLGAGLLDGINPCAFTTVIFLISYLSLVGQSRRQMFYIGGIFTLAVFITYLVIGLAFFNLIRLILKEQFVITGVNLVLLFLLVILAVLSFVDFFRCLKGKVTEITLQLPKFLKGKIRDRIRDFSKNKIAMPGAAFVLGIVIASMELACTGQVYIPIVTMLSEPRHRIAATGYLFLYNIAFIVPLFIVFLLATFGVTSERMGTVFGRHIAFVKFGLSVLFIIMAIMVIYNLRWF
ncbi:MAG: metallophosphoesterase [Planctomycetota bacterium]|jgi:cytochrome c biogenesis protein CcdA/thiol-disulfide isomerase/thioredoxin